MGHGEAGRLTAGSALLTSLVTPRPSSRTRPKAVPDPTRAVVTVASGSSLNIYKTSPFSYLGSLTFFIRVRPIKIEGIKCPYHKSTCFI